MSELKVLSKEALQDLEKANKLLGEMVEKQNQLTEVDYVKLLSGLYDLKEDVNVVGQKWRNLTKEKHFCIMKNQSDYNFRLHVPSILNDLIGMIERGELVFVNNQKQ